MMNRNVVEISPFLFTCRHVSKQFLQLPVLQDITFTVHSGEFISIVGPSGCGKTTLLRMIRGFVKPDDGEIVFNQELLNQRSEIGYIFQGTNLLPWRTVAENIRLPLELRHVPASEMQQKIDTVLEVTGLSYAAAKYPHQLSGGMKQLAALAKALVNDDKLILMDEPFASLDPATRETMAKRLHHLWKETNTTIIFVTHFIDEAVFLSDRVIVLSSQPTTIKYVANTSPCNGGDYNSYRYPLSTTISELMEWNGDINTPSHESSGKKELHLNAWRGRMGYFFSPLIAVLLVLVWHKMVQLHAYPEFILPAPMTVWHRLIDAASNMLAYHIGITTLEAVLGFLIGTLIAVLIGYPLAKIPFLEKIFYPYITASQTTPIIAIAPLLALWFGFGIFSKIVVAALIVFFPVLITTMTSLRDVSGELSEIMKDLNATRWQTLTKLEIPGAVPYLFATMRVAITLSLVGAVVGEFVSSNRGLGYLVITSKGVLDTPLLFVTIISLAAVGITLYSVILILERVFVKFKTGRGRK